MTDTIYILIILIPLILSTLGTSIGQGLIGKQALQSMLKQPQAADNISKLCIISTAITDTAGILGLVISILLINDLDRMHTVYSIYAIIGIACAMGISGLFAGIASAFPAIASCQSLARQPFLQTKILNLMLITQTLIMTPNIFSFLVSLLIKSKIAETQSFAQALQLLASGISVGFGCIGPSIGLSLFAYTACQAIGVNKKAFGKILTFTFICEAIIETPAIFALLISLMILNTKINPESALQGWQFIAAALCISLSTIAPGINSGRTAKAACNQIAFYPDSYPNMTKITMLALVMIDSFAIYGLLIAIIMILF